MADSPLPLRRPQLYGEFDKHYSTWMAVVRVVSQLDCLLSLSKSSAALGEPCVRPEIVESDTAIVEFEELRHPCVLKCVSLSPCRSPSESGADGVPRAQHVERLHPERRRPRRRRRQEPHAAHRPERASVSLLLLSCDAR